MKALISYFQSVIKKDEGQTLSEYALILALIAVIAIAALILLGGNIVNILNAIAGAL